MKESIMKNFELLTKIAVTIFGSLLTCFLIRISRFGRVKLHVNHISSTPSERTPSGAICNTKSITSNTIILDISFDLDLINTSEYSKKILRNIQFIAVDKNFYLSSSLLYNSSARQIHGMLLIDDLKNINLKPKEIKSLNLSVSFSKDFDKIEKSKWYFEYTKMNGKKDKFRITK